MPSRAAVSAGDLGVAWNSQEIPGPLVTKTTGRRAGPTLVAAFHDRVKQGLAVSEQARPETDGLRIIALARKDPDPCGQPRP